jgi:outer membrane protein OmpA-like peptidoglycan-associated protein
MGTLDTAKPFHRIEIIEPDGSEPKYVISPNVFLDNEKPSDNNSVTEIYLTNLNIISSIDSSVNICELAIKHNPDQAPTIKMDSLVKVYLGYYNQDLTEGPEYSLVYTGYVTRQQVHLRETTIECKSTMNRIITLRKKMAFSRSLTINEIIQLLVIEEGGLESANNGIAESNITKLPGYAISEQRPILDHVRKLTEYNGLNVYMDVYDKFHASAWDPSALQDSPSIQEGNWIDNRGKDESENTTLYKHAFTFGLDLIACNIELSGAKVSSVEIVGHMALADDPVHTIEPPEVEFVPESGSDPELPKKKYQISHIDRDDAEKIAENLYWRLNRQITGKIKVLGSPQVRLGDGVQIKGDIYEVEPFANIDFDPEGGGDPSALESKTFQVHKVNHKFSDSDGFISRLELIDAKPPVGVGEEEGGGEEEPEEEEPEEEEPEEEEQEEVEFLRLAGVNFNFDSAVVLTRDLGDIKAIIEKVNQSEKKLLVAGHTDRMGTDEYNLNLSALRARSVLAVSTDDSDLWDEIIESGKVIVKDYQMILKDFGFYDGDIDGNAANTRSAVREFQRFYNSDYDGDLEVDGAIGPLTWGAIFNVMVAIIDVSVDEGKFMDQRWIGCGEFRPVDRPGQDQVRSQENRRVEFLLYPVHRFPSLSAPYASRTAMEAAYNDEDYRFNMVRYHTSEITLPLEREARPTRTVTIIEVEDTLYHHDSAVLLPDQPAGPSSEDGEEPSEETEQITGITVISSIYNFMELNPEKKLIIAGHTDTSGRERYNFELSSLRGKSVLYLMEGNKDGWAQNSDNKNKVEDYQQILKHYWRLWGWNCDPGNIDNVLGPNTREATRNFQERYNTEFSESIPVNGRVELETWGAFYDCYIREIAQMQETTVEGLAEDRARINYVSEDYHILACGESHPIEEAERDHYRSQVNRRVEVLFFDPGEEPEINCPDPEGPYNNEVCDLADCPIYKPGEYETEYYNPALAGPPSSLPQIEVFFQKFPGKFDNAGISDVPYEFRVGGSLVSSGNTDSDGKATIVLRPGEVGTLRIFDTDYQIEIHEPFEAVTNLTGQQRRLRHLGYQLGHSGTDGNGVGVARNFNTERSILDFQTDHELPIDGNVDAATRTRLTTEAGG